MDNERRNKEVVRMLCLIGVFKSGLWETNWQTLLHTSEKNVMPRASPVLFFCKYRDCISLCLDLTSYSPVLGTCPLHHFAGGLLLLLDVTTLQ
ncbi:hypothetical protein MHYP_G00117900 [Metynnis hypsauchen]